MGWSRQERIELHDKMVVKLNEVRRELMRRYPDIVSVDLGIKSKEGKLVEELAWRVFVKKKQPANEISPDALIPREFAGLKTDVHQFIEGNDEELPDTASYRPLWGGGAIKNAFSAGGTLGFFVNLTATNTVHVVSNHHVLGHTPGMVVGQSKQPCQACCCCDGNHIAKMVDGYDVGAPGPAATNMDAAIAILMGQTAGDPYTINYVNSIIGIGPIFGSGTAQVGDVVRKRGATTGLTRGTIVSTTSTPTISAKNYTDFLAINHITEDWSEGGDSGSGVVNNLNQIVGLHKGGGGLDGHGVKIANIESRFGVTVLNSVQVGHPDSIPLSGVELMPPPVLTATPTHFLSKVENLLQKTTEGQAFLQVVHENRTEVLDLINDNREVKVAWNRYQGPSFVGHFAKNVMEPSHRFPAQIEGYSFQNLLIKMTDVLERHGSRKLAKAIEDYSPIAFNFADQYEGFDSLDTLLRKANLCPNCGQPQTLNDYAE